MRLSIWRCRRARNDYYLAKLKNYGSLFLGEESTVAYGDKGVGTNHTLPTGRAARYTGGLWVGKFLKTVTYQTLTPEASQRIAPIIGRMCAAEGMLAHELTATVRVERYAQRRRARRLKTTTRVCAGNSGVSKKHCIIEFQGGSAMNNQTTRLITEFLPSIGARADGGCRGGRGIELCGSASRSSRKAARPARCACGASRALMAASPSQP